MQKRKDPIDTAKIMDDTIIEFVEKGILNMETGIEIITAYHIKLTPLIENQKFLVNGKFIDRRKK